VEAALFSALAIDAMLYLPVWGGPVFLGLVLTALFFLQQPLVVGSKIQAVPAGVDLACFGLLAAALIGLAWMLRLFRARLHGAMEIQARLGEAAGQLARTNVELQEFAASTEQKATLSERKRLARDLHDSLGYSFTNLVMMLEAGMCMLKGALPELREHLQRARDLSQEGLQEMRRTLRIIRQNEAETVGGIKAVFRLVKSFEQATGLDVKLHLGDVPWTLGPDKDQIVYRFVQEGISNALRHGNATSISIVFCRRDDGVLVSINDNGSGFVEMAEGGGLVGMRERIEKVGGTTSIASQPGLGTVLSAWLHSGNPEGREK
jgi:signal transduction histidine kinase